MGGYLEYADLFVYGYKGLENVTLVLNEEGLIRNLPFNRGLVPQEDNIMGQPVGEVLNGTYGRAFFVGLTRTNEYRSLTDDELEALKKYFEKPQRLVRFDNKLLAVSV